MEAVVGQFDDLLVAVHQPVAAHQRPGHLQLVDLLAQHVAQGLGLLEVEDGLRDTAMMRVQFTHHCQAGQLGEAVGALELLVFPSHMLVGLLARQGTDGCAHFLERTSQQLVLAPVEFWGAHALRHTILTFFELRFLGPGLGAALQQMLVDLGRLHF
jgi:hypothetical protein